MTEIIHASTQQTETKRSLFPRPANYCLALLYTALMGNCLLPPAGAQPAESSGHRTEPTGASEEKDPAEAAQRALDRMFNDPLSGVVVNRTVTVLGKDFYRYFSTYWRYSPDSARYSISIHERPTARFGSEIWVLYRQQTMFHIFLPPARQATRRISEIAVEQVLENISQRELERLTTRNPDLGPEEL